MDHVEDEESCEHTLLLVRGVNVYKMAARSTSGGWKCAEWLVADKIWTGRLRVISHKERCEIRLEDSSTGELFATCPVALGKREASVETVTDSSRYFVLKIDDGKGRHAFIGLGFNERNEAFDFNVALSDFEKHVGAEREKAQQSVGKPATEYKPPEEYRLKEGQTLRINMAKPVSSGLGVKKLSTTSAGEGAGSMASTGRMLASFAPPPGGHRLRAPLPPSEALPLPKLNEAHRSAHVNAASSAQPSGGSQPAAAFHDLSQLEGTFPSQSNGTSKSSTAAVGWAAF
eukprot:jgi/Mesen1/9818/ME000007S09874